MRLESLAVQCDTFLYLLSQMVEREPTAKTYNNIEQRQTARGPIAVAQARWLYFFPATLKPFVSDKPGRHWFLQTRSQNLHNRGSDNYKQRRQG